jgi:hypothetical protein
MQSQEFVDDIKKLFTLPPDSIIKLPGLALRVLAASGYKIEGIADEASKELDIPRWKLDNNISITNFFIHEFTDDGNAALDQPDNVASDAQKLFNLPDDLKPTTVDYFRQIKNLAASEAKLILLRKAYAKSSLPNLESVTTTINFRAVFNKCFNKDSDLVSFQPKCLGTIPIGIINLNISNSSKEKIFFQTDKKSLRWLIESLQALEKELETAQAYLSLTEVKTDE